MAYNYLPGAYQAPGYAPARPQPSGGLNWVQGENGAKAYPVAPNTTVLLMDSEGDRFYLKTVDYSGLPQPLRVFEYREITARTNAPEGSAVGGQVPSYVTHEEFEALKRTVESLAEVKDEQPV